MPTPPASMSDRAEKIRARIEFHAVETVVFLRPDGVLDSAPSWSPRGSALLKGSDLGRAGYRIVGVYSPGVSTEQLAADVRAVWS